MSSLSHATRSLLQALVRRLHTSSTRPRAILAVSLSQRSPTPFCWQKKYSELDPRSAPPHIFAIGETAYRAIARKGKYRNQAIIVSGESGAGKTVGNKLLMDYFAYRSGESSDSSTTAEIAKVMHDSNPVLEAFGNAKTTRNSNSSRFGKFQIMNFSERGEIGTITIATYLLEKSRVTSITDPERNYHAFYMLLAGGGNLLGDLELSPTVGDYNYLKQSTCHAIPDWNDVEEFRIMADAMPVIGADTTRSLQIFTMLAAVLLLGNVQFHSGDSDETLISNPDVLDKASRRLGVSSEDLSTILTSRELKGPRGGGVITKALSVAASQNGRDSISKAIFVRVFDWLVACMNSTIKDVGMRGGQQQAEERFIGLVDLFGFEMFKVNSFEQLCINFANEKLQQFFLQYVFYTEETIHKEEGVTWPSVELPDNQGAIDVISMKDTGILFLLDSASKLQGAKEGTFFESVNDTHKKSRFYKKPKGLRMNEGFCVKHYAGDVIYHAGTYAAGADAVTWLDKNNYALAADQERVLYGSSVPLLSELFMPAGAESDSKAKVPQVKSASKTFMSNLEELMTVLASTQVQFVRCVKSCMEQQPGFCSGKMVLNQLRCNGTMEAVEVMQAAYPSRIAYDLIHGNIVGYLPDFMQQMTPNAFFEVLMAALDIPREKYQLGMTKLFMKAGTGRALEELAEMDIDEMVPILLAKVQEFERKKKAGILLKATIMRYNRRKRFLLMRESVLTVQRIHRKRNARRRFLTFVAVLVEVNREMKAQQEQEEIERKKREEEAEKLRAVHEAAAAKQAETDAAELAELAASDAEAAEKLKAEQAAAADKLRQEQQEARERVSSALPGGSMQMDEPDIGARLGEDEEEDEMVTEFKERMGDLGISPDILSRVSKRFVEQEKARKTTMNRHDMDGMEEEDGEPDEDETDEEEDEEGMTLNSRGPAGDDKVFEVIIVRHETTGSLGLELDEYKSSPTVCAIMLGGPADQDGTLQMGDTVVAIDGKPTHNMEDVKRAVISAASSSLRLAVLRKPVVVMRRERAYMNMPDTPEDEEWEQFEITLFSNRQLTFEKLSPPFVFGSIELPAAKSLRLMKVQYNVCLQICTSERSFEFYTDSLMTLYEWQRMLRSLMLSNTISVMSGWLTLVTNTDQQLKRWWFDLCGSTYLLCYFETDQCQALNLPAQGCIDLAEVRVVESINSEAIAPIIAERRAAQGGELRERVRLMCDVQREDETMPIGIELSPDFEITRFGSGSPAEISSGEGGLQVGDQLLAVDGHEVETGPKKKKNKAVKELLRDLDTFPKQVHTFTVERSVPVVIQDSGAVQIKAKGDHWIVYPCSADEVPLSKEEYQRALDAWLTALKDCAKEAREAADGATQEQVLQQLWVELEEDDDWKPYYCCLTAKNGLSFYDEKEDALNTPKQPVVELGLDRIRGAGRAPGIDFYDGVIDVEVYGYVEDMWRIKPASHAAMHNLLSAINIYKVSPSAADMGGGGATTRRGGGGTSRGGQATKREGSLSHRGGGGGSGDGSSTNRGGGGLTSRLFGFGSHRTTSRDESNDHHSGSQSSRGNSTSRGGGNRPPPLRPLAASLDEESQLGSLSGLASDRGGQKSSRGLLSRLSRSDSFGRRRSQGNLGDQSARLGDQSARSTSRRRGGGNGGSSTDRGKSPGRKMSSMFFGK